VLVENLKVQLIRPPVPVRPGSSRRGGRGRDYWVLAFAAGHVRPSSCLGASAGWFSCRRLLHWCRALRPALIAHPRRPPADDAWPDRGSQRGLTTSENFPRARRRWSGLGRRPYGRAPWTALPREHAEHHRV